MTGLIKLTEILKVQNHVHDVEIPEKIVAVSDSDVANFKELFDNFRKQLAENKPKKGKKGGKGGKKKKKKA